MKKKILYSILAILIVVHFLFLYFLGISTYTTTLLFYFLLYLLLKFFVSFIKNGEWRKTVLINIRIFLILLLLIEFFYTFFLKTRNEYMEDQIGMYFSPYMHNAQINFLSKTGLTRAGNAWEEGYAPNFRHQHKTSDFLYNVTYNSLGLRGSLPPVKKDSNEFRIVVLGDSFVEGYGTNEDSTFPKLLQNDLEKFRDHITVINGGICGSNPKSEVVLYHRVLEQFHPDLVILEVNESDVEDYYVALHQGKMPFDEYGYAMSHLMRLWDEKTADGDSIPIKRKLSSIHSMIHHLNQFKADLARNNQQFVVVSLSLQTQLYGQTGMLDSVLMASNLPVIDLKKYYWVVDGHHTPLGYSLMAKTVAQQLMERKYVGIH